MRELLADRMTDDGKAWVDTKIVIRARKRRARWRSSSTRARGSSSRARPGARARSTRCATASYGTNVVAGVTPGKGGTDLEGIPIFDTVARGGRRDRREHDDGLRAGALRGGRDLRGGRRRDRDRDLHRRRAPRPRDAARLQLHPAEGDHDARPELPGCALAGQGERRDHPRRDLPRGRDRRRLALGHADLPDRPRADAARARQLDHRRDRRRPRRRLVVHRRARRASRPTPRRR